jgi:hypothetical protein
MLLDALSCGISSRSRPLCTRGVDEKAFFKGILDDISKLILSLIFRGSIFAMPQQAYLRDHFNCRCCCIRWRSPREWKLMLVSSNTLESRKAIKLNVSNLLLLSGFLPIFLARLRARNLCWLSYLVPSTLLGCPRRFGLSTPSLLFQPLKYDVYARSSPLLPMPSSVAWGFGLRFHSWKLILLSFQSASLKTSLWSLVVKWNIGRVELKA